MFGSSLPLVVCRRANVLFTLLAFLRIVVCFLFCLSCVPNVTSFSGLSICIALSVCPDVYWTENISNIIKCIS